MNLISALLAYPTRYSELGTVKHTASLSLAIQPGSNSHRINYRYLAYHGLFSIARIIPVRHDNNSYQMNQSPTKIQSFIVHYRNFARIPVRVRRIPTQCRAGTRAPFTVCLELPSNRIHQLSSANSCFGIFYTHYTPPINRRHPQRDPASN